MKILLVNAFFPPRTTGSAHFARDVSRRWACAGNEVTVLTTAVDGAAPEEHRHGVRVIRVPARELNPRRLSFNYALPFVARRRVVEDVTSLMRDLAPDVVHQNGQFFDLTFITTAAAQRLDIPRVLTIHTPLLHSDAAITRGIGAIETTLLRALNAPGAPVIVGVDRTVCALAQQRYRPRQPVRFIPATLEIDRFRGGDGRAVRARHGIDQHAPVILSLGHVIPTRSRRDLIRALPRIRQRHPAVVVLVVGGVYDTTFLDEARRLGVDDAIRVAGPVPHHEVVDHLAAATVECHDLEGRTLGITTMEAMAAGVPVFARVRHDVFPGIDFAEWQDLQIVDTASPESIADSLCALLECESLRRRVVAAQRRFVSRHFAAERVAQQYLDLFSEVAPGATRRAPVRSTA